MRILCSHDKPAPSTIVTLEALLDKHPPGPADRRPPCDPKRQLRFSLLNVSPEDLKKVLRALPHGSSVGWSYSAATLKHIREILSGISDDKLLIAIIELINLFLAGSFNKEINEIIHVARLIAFG